MSSASAVSVRDGSLLVEQALGLVKRAGADAADIVLVRGRSLEARVRGEVVDFVKQAQEQVLGTRVLMTGDGGISSAVTSTSALAPNTLEQMARAPVAPAPPRRPAPAHPPAPISRLSCRLGNRGSCVGAGQEVRVFWVGASVNFRLGWPRRGPSRVDWSWSWEVCTSWVLLALELGGLGILVLRFLGIFIWGV